MAKNFLSVPIPEQQKLSYERTVIRDAEDKDITVSTQNNDNKQYNTTRVQINSDVPNHRLGRLNEADTPHTYQNGGFHSEFSDDQKNRIMYESENDDSSSIATGVASNNEANDTASAVSHILREKSSRSRSTKFQRLIFKNGECNIGQTNISKRKRRFISDIFTTLVDLKWRYTIALFICAFVVSWLFFATLWFLIAYIRDDLKDFNTPRGNLSCVVNIRDFSSAVLFSVETQHAIGYGYRYVSNECTETIIMLMMQACFGVIIQALMTGLVFAKLSRPKKRAETLMFSKTVVICEHDNNRCLMIRVGDMRRSQLLEAHLRGILVKKFATPSTHGLPLEQYDINFGYDRGYDRLFMMWPLTVEHRIDDNSPLWDVSASDFNRDQFELIVILEGIVEATGMTTQARCSYVPSEVQWGYEFDRLMTYQKENGEYKIDYAKFHHTHQLPHFSRSSAKQEQDEKEAKLLADRPAMSIANIPDIIAGGCQCCRVLLTNTATDRRSLLNPPSPTATKRRVALASQKSGLQGRIEGETPAARKWPSIRKLTDFRTKPRTRKND